MDFSCWSLLMCWLQIVDVHSAIIFLKSVWQHMKYFWQTHKYMHTTLSTTVMSGHVNHPVQDTERINSNTETHFDDTFYLSSVYFLLAEHHTGQSPHVVLQASLSAHLPKTARGHVCDSNTHQLKPHSLHSAPQEQLLLARSAALRRFDHMFLPLCFPDFLSYAVCSSEGWLEGYCHLGSHFNLSDTWLFGTLSTWLKKLSVQPCDHLSGMVVTSLIYCCMCEMTQYHRTPGTHSGCATAMLWWEAAERAGQAGSHPYRVFLTVRSGQRIQDEVSNNALSCMNMSQNAEMMTTLLLTDVPSV